MKEGRKEGGPNSRISMGSKTTAAVVGMMRCSPYRGVDQGVGGYQKHEQTMIGYHGGSQSSSQNIATDSFLLLEIAYNTEPAVL
jgi:uncharacterized protein YodC (DUF2158 family)